MGDDELARVEADLRALDRPDDRRQHYEVAAAFDRAADLFHQRGDEARVRSLH